MNSTEVGRALHRYAAHFAAVMEREGPRLLGAGEPDEGRVQLAALKFVGEELPNILYVLETALDRAEEQWLLALARHLSSYFAMTGGFGQARYIYDRLLAAAKRIGSPSLELQAQLGLSRALYRLGTYPEAEAAGQAALGIASESEVELAAAYALGQLGTICYARGEYAPALELHERSLALSRRLGHAVSTARTLTNMGNVCFARGEYDRALELLEESLETAQQVGDAYGEAVTLGSMGNAHYVKGDIGYTLELYGRSLAISQRLGDTFTAAVTLCNMGSLHQLRHEPKRALELYEQGLTAMQELGDAYGAAQVRGSMGSLYAARGESQRALALYAQCLRNLQRLRAKKDMALYCALAGAVLGESGNSAAGTPGQETHDLGEAALIVHAAVDRAAELAYHFEAEDQERVDAAVSRFETSVALGDLHSDEYGQLLQRAQTLQLDALVELTLRALPPEDEDAEEAETS